MSVAWRLLTADGVGAAEGLACDEAMMLHHGRGGAAATEATLRLYTYRAHCALVGRYQDVAAEVDLDVCRAAGIQVGRRPTGGGAIIMGPDQLGVAIAARAVPEEAPRETLRRYARGVIAGLAALGVEAAFRSKNDLEVGGRKIAGLGLYLDPRGAVLFHASVLAGLDVALMLRVLRIPGAKLSDKAVTQVSERVTTISRQLGAEVSAAAVRERFAAALAGAFAARLEPGDLDAAEREAMRRRLEQRYGSREWVFRRSHRPDARGSALLKTPEGLLRIFAALDGESIKSVLITGDFNAPPPALPRLEAELKWCRAEPPRIAAAVEAALAGGDLGVPAAAVAAAVWEAASAALELQRAGHPVRPEGSCYLPEAHPGTSPETRPAEKEAR